MHDYSVKIRNPFSQNTTEGKWIRFQQESGIGIDQIVENVNRVIGGCGENGQYTRLVVEYVLGRKDFHQIEHLLTPYMPSSLSFVGAVSEGFLCQASGESEEACFEVLLALPRIEENKVRELVEHNQSQMCYLAYKRAHEGYPAEYEMGKSAPSCIRHAHVADLLPE